MDQDDSRPELTAVRALAKVFTSIPREQPRSACPCCSGPMQARDSVVDGGGFVSYRTAYLCWTCGTWRIDNEETWTSDY